MAVDASLTSASSLLSAKHAFEPDHIVEHPPARANMPPSPASSGVDQASASHSSPRHGNGLDVFSERPLSPRPFLREALAPSGAFSAALPPPLSSSPCAHSLDLAPIQPNSDTSSPTSLPPLISLISATAGAPPPQAFPAQQHQHQFVSLQQHHHRGHSAPDPFQTSTSSVPATVSRWSSLNPLTTFYTSDHDQGVEPAQTMDRDSDRGASPQRGALTPDSCLYDARTTSVGPDDRPIDPDVWLAAEALGKMRADLRSPRQQPEPLLALLSNGYPAIGATIERTASYYTNISNSSSYLKRGTEYAENCLSPVANAFGHVSRTTGVEASVRRYLETRSPRQSFDLEAAGSASPRSRQWSDVELGGPNKRRKTETTVQISTVMGNGTGAPSPGTSAPSPIEAESFAFYFPQKDRRASMSTVSTLPPYDTNMSPPAYAEGAVAESGGNYPPRASARRWHMAPPNLRHAINEAGLQSLKYCLQWLNGANSKIGRLIVTVRDTVERYNDTALVQSHHQGANAVGGSAGRDDSGAFFVSIKEEEGRTPTPVPVPSGEMVRHLLEIQDDLARTMNGVVSTVSKYAGGAVPENLRVFVRNFLMRTLPRRLNSSRDRDSRQPTQQDGGAGNTADSVSVIAQRVLSTAGDALDWVGQMSAMVNDIIGGAERWLDAPRDNDHEGHAPSAAEEPKKSGQDPTGALLTSVGYDEDTKMSGV